MPNSDIEILWKELEDFDWKQISQEFLEEAKENLKSHCFRCSNFTYLKYLIKLKADNIKGYVYVCRNIHNCMRRTKNGFKNSNF